MKNALTYLTRRCTRKCQYCALRDAKGVGEELNVHQWIQAFEILQGLGIEFNLILGNETWLLGDGLPILFQKNRVPYALYTTCPEPLFSRYKDILLGGKVIDNLSCGVDWPYNSAKVDDDSWAKSQDAWKGFQWLRGWNKGLDCQGTMTVHKGNFQYLPQVVEQLDSLGIFCGVNFIHWNKDGGFDFFPDKEELANLLFAPEDLPKLREVLDNVLQSPRRLQNPEMLACSVEELTQMGWHCGGDPYGGPSIDADGKLRVCGYRKGARTPKLTIFDLPKHLDDWKEAVYLDAKACIGCAWSYTWMFHYWQDHNQDLGRKVFVNHAGENIPEENWSVRNM